MAIINMKTGYYGFTIDQFNGSTSDNHGNVKKAIFVIVYPYRSGAVHCNISKGDEDWAAWFGDGSIINLQNPKVLYENRDNAVIEFDMETSYPSNSPCFLVYRSDTASFTVDDAVETDEFTPNTASGHWAYTTEGYEGGSYDHGLVDRLIATIPFPEQEYVVEFKISEDPYHWGVRMGDGSIVRLSDPNVIYLNQNNAVIVFSMETPYPSNSPGILVYMDEEAWYSFSFIEGEYAFIYVSDILGIPNNIFMGIEYDLNNYATIMPENASCQGIEWMVVSGNATINDSILVANEPGTIEIRAIIPGGGYNKEDYIQTFSIIVNVNISQIIAQPVSELSEIYESDEDSIGVIANSDTGDLSYQWYSNSINALSGAVKLDNETSNSLSIKTNATGDQYVFCKISSDGAETITSGITHISTSAELKGININGESSVIPVTDTATFIATPNPSVAELPQIAWTTDNAAVIHLNNNTGSSVSIDAVSVGSATLTATTVNSIDASVYSNTYSINVTPWIAVTSITPSVQECDDKNYVTLSATVAPTDASKKNIIWSVEEWTPNGNYDPTDTPTITNGQFYAYGPGVAKIKMTIIDGIYKDSNFETFFEIKVNKSFVAVSDINVEFSINDTKLSPNESGIYEIYPGDLVKITPKIIPADASSRDVNFELVSIGTSEATLEGNLISAKSKGTFTLRATCLNGVSETENFTKDIIFQSYDKWVPVSQVTMNTSESYNPFEDLTYMPQLSFTVAPTDASKNDIKLTLGSNTNINVYTSTDPTTQNKFPADGTVDGTKIWVNPNEIELDEDTAQYIHYTIEIHLSIKDGIARGYDFEQNFIINVDPPETDGKYVPITDIEIVKPIPCRAWYPILVNRSIISPFNASIKSSINLNFKNIRRQEYGGADSISIRNIMTDNDGNQIGAGATEKFIDKPILDYTGLYASAIEWNTPNTYLFTYDKGISTIEIDIPGGIDENTPYEETFIINFESPYIPIKDVSNIPSEIIAGKEYIFSPEFETDHGTHYSTYTWDEETPSYTEFTLSTTIDDTGLQEYPNTAGGEIRNDDTKQNIIYADHAGKYTFDINVENGIQEAVDWYSNIDGVGNYQGGISYKKTVTVNVVDDTTTIDPLVELTLNSKTNENYDVIKVYSLGDFYKLCNDRPADSEITIDNTTFKKNQVTSVKFWDKVDLVEEDNIIPIENITLYSSKVAKSKSITISNATISPTNATNVSIDWSIEAQYDETDPDNPNLGSIIGDATNVQFKAGNHDGYVILRATSQNGLSEHQDYTKCFIITVGSPSNNVMGAININPVNKVIQVYAGEVSNLELNATLVGNDADYNTRLAGYVSWSSTDLNVEITDVPSNKLTTKIKVNEESTEGTLIEIVATVTDPDTETPDVILATQSFFIYVAKRPLFFYEDTPVKSLRNFGRNFTSLTSIDRIPLVSAETDAYRNFLMGCTSFNQDIEIPVGVTGPRCLKYFLRDCTSFNGTITIPGTVTGEGCMHGFLYNCDEFNQPLVLPDGITGESCVERLLAKCSKFNSPINFPDSITGKRCMRDVLWDAFEFNQSITLPKNLSGEESIWNFMYNTWAFTETITISQKNMINAGFNGLAFTSVDKNGATIQAGALISGTGADLFIAQYPKNIDYRMYSNFRKDPDWVQPEANEFMINCNGCSVHHAETSFMTLKGSIGDDGTITSVPVDSIYSVGSMYIVSTAKSYAMNGGYDTRFETSKPTTVDEWINSCDYSPYPGRTVFVAVDPDHDNECWLYTILGINDSNIIYNEGIAATADQFGEVDDILLAEFIPGDNPTCKWRIISSADIQYNEYSGETVDIYITPEENTVFKSATYGDETNTVNLELVEDNHFRFIMPEGSITINIDYELINEP